VPWRARDFVHQLLRRRGGRPQLKRDPLGSFAMQTTTNRRMLRAFATLMLSLAAAITARALSLSWVLLGLAYALFLVGAAWLLLELRRSRRWSASARDEAA